MGITDTILTTELHKDPQGVVLTGIADASSQRKHLPGAFKLFYTDGSPKLPNRIPREFNPRSNLVVIQTIPMSMWHSGKLRSRIVLPGCVGSEAGADLHGGRGASPYA